jgi:hypothetical protein
MFQRLKIPIEYATYPFYWNDPDIRYPSQLRELADELPLEYHVACKAYLAGRWVLVDATWDSPLKKAGFPINESWDGVNDTKNAVKPLDEIIHKNVQERIEFMKSKNASCSEKDYLLFRNFYDKLNIWLEEIRAN